MNLNRDICGNKDMNSLPAHYNNYIQEISIASSSYMLFNFYGECCYITILEPGNRFEYDLTHFYVNNKRTNFIHNFPEKFKKLLYTYA